MMHGRRLVSRTVGSERFYRGNCAEGKMSDAWAIGCPECAGVFRHPIELCIGAIIWPAEYQRAAGCSNP